MVGGRFYGLGFRAGGVGVRQWRGKQSDEETARRVPGGKATRRPPDGCLPVARRPSLLVVQSSPPDTACQSCRAQTELAGGAVLLARHCLSVLSRADRKEEMKAQSESSVGWAIDFQGLVEIVRLVCGPGICLAYPSDMALQPTCAERQVCVRLFLLFLLFHFSRFLVLFLLY